MSQRCTFVESDGFHHCGSYAFNLQRDGIDQGTLCDVHYWQARAAELENAIRDALHFRSNVEGILRQALTGEKPEPIPFN
jgi:hypothetical protein